MSFWLALNSKETIEKASLVNMKVQTVNSGENSRDVKSFEISVIAKDIIPEEN